MTSRDQATSPEQSASPRPPASRSPLLRRDYALIWSAGLVSDTGDWLLMIALPLFAFAATGSALGASTVFLVELVPMLLLGTFLGVLVDRWDRRRTIIVTALLQAVALLPLLAASADRMWIVYTVAAVEACLGAVINPARQALVPSLVEPDQLARGNALIAVSDSIARLVGSPLGGIAFAAGGLPGVVVADAATFLITAALVAFMRRTPRSPRTTPAAEEAPAAVERRLLREWREGLALIGRSGTLRTLAVITALGSVSQGLFLVLFIVYVTQDLGAGDAGVGLLRGVQAIGGVLGGLLSGMLVRRLAPRALVGAGYLAFGLLSLLTWNLAPFTTALGVYAGLFIAMGIPAVATATGEITLVQTATPPHALGRVIAAMTTVAGAAQGVGLLAGGLLAERFDVVTILDGQAALYLACGVIALLALRPPTPVLPRNPPGMPGVSGNRT
ncbi:MFS transporter [Leifsonia sp. ZF2019]|uniref:MFS transporter n=1 Tax=Leifsonia sp. ZF2019 TaxID=2781978 RepID=UPI001CC1050F|nr:MFS transporter [Leifsonia sp. ZF2019]UAJ78496.1 MFS transporter [Leifsonia sp. ZF2019]